MTISYDLGLEITFTDTKQQFIYLKNSGLIKKGFTPFEYYNLKIPDLHSFLELRPIRYNATKQSIKKFVSQYFTKQNVAVMVNVTKLRVETDE